jgi:NitT/TauT family transport system substrate-binding protein
VRISRTIAAAITTVVGLLAVTACGGSATSSHGSRVVIEYNPTLYSWLGVIAQKQGFLKDNGVDAKLEQIQNGTLATTALTSGDIDLAFLDLSLVSGYLNKGEHFTAITGTGKMAWDMVAPKSASAATFPASVHSLAGQPVGVPALGSVAYYYARAYLQAAGVNPDNVHYVAVGPFAQVPAAISQGQVKAAVVTPDQTYQLQKSGGVNVLFSSSKDRSLVPPPMQKVIGVPGAFYWARSDWAKKNPTLVGEVQRAMAQADVWAHDPANLSKVTSILSGLSLLPKTFSSQAETEAYVKYSLGFMSSAASQADMAASIAFWKSNKVLTADVSAKELLSAGTPADEAAVSAMAK